MGSEQLAMICPNVKSWRPDVSRTLDTGFVMYHPLGAWNNNKVCLWPQVL